LSASRAAIPKLALPKALRCRVAASTMKGSRRYRRQFAGIQNFSLPPSPPPRGK
jgi:hypothetical protein